MAAVFTALALGQARVAMTPAHMVLIAPRWFALAALLATIGLQLSRLVSRHGSHLIAFGLLALFATVFEQQGVLLRGDLAWLARAAEAIASPMITLLREPVLPVVPAPLAQAVGLLVVYIVGLFALAVWLFRRKDLLWVD